MNNRPQFEYERDRHWTDDAHCRGDLSNDMFVQPSSRLHIIQAFVEKNCMNCLVAQDCLDDRFVELSTEAVVDTLEFTVRGGYLPYAQNLHPKGRPRIYDRTGIVPRSMYDSDGNIRKCKNKLHEMTADNILIDPKKGFQRCKACNLISQRKAAGKRIAGGSKPRRRKCNKKLHYIEGENVLMRNGLKHCKICTEEREERTSKRVCPNGHVVYGENAYFLGKRTYCKICYDARSRATIEA